jgi:dienelactone hydrolase
VVYTPESGLNLPAVAFAHGWLTSAENYKSLLEHIASWGFVVAAPDTERGPIPSHLDLGTDLLTTLDIVSKVRLGDGTISVHPDRLALAGHGMGAGAAVIAAAQRRVAAVVALFPAPTSPAAENIAPDIAPSAAPPTTASSKAAASSPPSARAATNTKPTRPPEPWSPATSSPPSSPTRSTRPSPTRKRRSPTPR